MYISNLPRAWAIVYERRRHDTTCTETHSDHNFDTERHRQEHVYREQSSRKNNGHANLTYHRNRRTYIEYRLVLSSAIFHEM